MPNRKYTQSRTRASLGLPTRPRLFMSNSRTKAFCQMDAAGARAVALDVLCVYVAAMVVEVLVTILVLS